MQLLIIRGIFKKSFSFYPVNPIIPGSDSIRYPINPTHPINPGSDNYPHPKLN
jgi:hypothetical protein